MYIHAHTVPTLKVLCDLVSTDTCALIPDLETLGCDVNHMIMTGGYMRPDYRTYTPVHKPDYVYSAHGERRLGRTSNTSLYVASPDYLGNLARDYQKLLQRNLTCYRGNK